MTGGLPVPEMWVGSRDFPLRDDYEVRPAARRVLALFAAPNRQLQPDVAAWAAFRCIEAYYNVKSAVACDRGD
eukprot:1447482-Alexandrium_andersonii.AAC.1